MCGSWAIDASLLDVQFLCSCLYSRIVCVAGSGVCKCPSRLPLSCISRPHKYSAGWGLADALVPTHRPMSANTSTASPVPPALPQGAGYGICVGLGGFFGLTMWYISKLLARYLREVQGSEMFMTAKRSINTGLIASAVVSSWTIAATLLTSSTWTYLYGVSGAYVCTCVLIWSS